MAGDEDNRHVADVRQPAYPPRGVETVQVREAAVHQDQVRACALRQLDGLLAVGGLDDRVASNLQHGAEQETRVRVVFRDEDERRRVRRVLRSRCVLYVAQRSSHVFVKKMRVNGRWSSPQATKGKKKNPPSKNPPFTPPRGGGGLGKWREQIRIIP